MIEMVRSFNRTVTQVVALNDHYLARGRPLGEARVLREIDEDRRFDRGYDPAKGIPADPADIRPPNGLFLIATLGREAVGCGALKFHGDEHWFEKPIG